MVHSRLERFALAAISIHLVQFFLTLKLHRQSGSYTLCTPDLARIGTLNKPQNSAVMTKKLQILMALHIDSAKQSVYKTRV